MDAIALLKALRAKLGDARVALMLDAETHERLVVQVTNTQAPPDRRFESYTLEPSDMQRSPNDIADEIAHIHDAQKTDGR